MTWRMSMMTIPCVCALNIGNISSVGPSSIFPAILCMRDTWPLSSLRFQLTLVCPFSNPPLTLPRDCSELTEAVAESAITSKLKIERRTKRITRQSPKSNMTQRAKSANIVLFVSFASAMSHVSIRWCLNRCHSSIGKPVVNWWPKKAHSLEAWPRPSRLKVILVHHTRMWKKWTSLRT